MVAIINCGKSIRRAFQYNENKLEGGAATVLRIENYPHDEGELDANQRLHMLQKLIGLREDVQVNSVHISLNFAPQEQFTDKLMADIAKEYMDGIGFGNQPYTVYRHHDSGHPHCHIVTTNIELDGGRLSLHNIGGLKSEPTRKALEEKHGLVKAEQHRKELFSLKPVDATKVRYGKTETKGAIANVLANVIEKYKFTSLPELNAVLGLYNVSAERGGEDSRIFKNRGLVYRVLDANGKPVGVPVKASLFHNKPTLGYLEKRFLKNAMDRQEHKGKVKSTIDFTIKSKQPKTVESLADALKNSGINMVLRRNKEGLLYGITYVDFKTKCVFNGSALGKNYSAKAMLERLESPPGKSKKTNEPTQLKAPQPLRKPMIPTGKPFADGSEMPSETTGKSLLELLTQYEYASQQVPFDWRKRKKRKKKR